MTIRTLTLHPDKTSLDALPALLKNHWRENPETDLRVQLAPGRHPITDTLILGHEECPPKHRQLFIEAQDESQPPIITSGIPITNWTKASDSEHVWVAPLPASLDRPRSLFGPHGRLQRARTDVFMPILAEGMDDRRYMKYPEGLIPDDYDATNLTLSLIPHQRWVHNQLDLASVNRDTRTLKTTAPSTYSLRPVGWGWYPEGHAWLENAPHYIQGPGQWAIDYTNRLVYLWPEGLADLDAIHAPCLVELIRVEGEIDHDAPTDTPVSNIHFKQLVYTEADYFHWEEDHPGWGCQHDWEMYDRPTAMLRFRGAAQCSVKDCSFTQSSASAIRFDLTCHQNTVSHSRFEHLGGVGVLCAGYGPGTKDTNHHNSITDCDFSFVGETYWHSPAIFLWQSGHNQITKNRITHTPYSGIVISGRITWNRDGDGECARTIRWHETDPIKDVVKYRDHWDELECFLHARHNLIESNDISDVMLMIGDGNGVYLSGAGRENMIRRNLIHHCDSLSMNAALRSDDRQHDTHFIGNIIWHTVGEGILIKGRCVIEHNIIGCLQSHDSRGHFTNYQRGHLALVNGNLKPSRIQHNICYSATVDQTLIHLGKPGKLGTPRLEDCQMDHNLYYNTEDPSWAEGYLQSQQSLGMELSSDLMDPGIQVTEAGFIRLDHNSPAIALGFDLRSSAIHLMESSQVPDHLASDVLNRFWPRISIKIGSDYEVGDE